MSKELHVLYIHVQAAHLAALGVLLCLVACLTFLASFFLPSSSL